MKCDKNASVRKKEKKLLEENTSQNDATQIGEISQTSKSNFFTRKEKTFTSSFRNDMS